MILSYRFNEFKMRISFNETFLTSISVCNFEVGRLWNKFCLSPYMKQKLIFLFILFMSFHKEDVAGQDKDLREIKNEAFKSGEVLEYRVHYGFIDAGEARLEISNEEKSVGGRPCFHMIGTGKSVGAFDWFFKVRDRYETFVDKSAIVPWLFIRRVDEGGYTINQNVMFNHHKKIATSEKSTLSIPENLQDLVSAFYYARTIDMSSKKTGDIIEIYAWLDDEIIPLHTKIIGREKIKTKLGTFNCIALRPLLQQGRVFKDNEDMTIWVTDDKNHIPVRAEAKILVGSIKMDLKKYSGLANPVNFAK